MDKRKINTSTTASLVLGTAQLGMKYGIANKNGMPDQDKADSIVLEAWQQGIREYDTAQVYGRSEKVLGRALCRINNNDGARIITKLDPSTDCSDKNSLKKALDNSLKRLGVHALHALLLHNEKHLDLWHEGLAEALAECIDSGKVQHIGISIYMPQNAAKALNMQGIDVVQVPANIIDQRFERNGIFELAGRLNKQIYIRSVYLQGLLLLNDDDINANMKFVLPVLKKFQQIASEFDMTPQELAFGYVRTKFPHAKIIFGADHPFHVSENIKAANTILCEKFLNHIKTIFNSIESRIIDPRLWPKKQS